MSTIRDFQHIGDSSLAKIWGDRTGLVLDGVNDTAVIATDATFRAGFNQNQPITIEWWSRGIFTATNYAYLVSPARLAWWSNVHQTQSLFFRSDDTAGDRRQGSIIAGSVNTGRLQYNCVTYDGTRLASPQGFQNFMQRQRLPSVALTGNPPLNSGDNVYLGSNNIVIGLDYFDGITLRACTFCELRIYTRIISAAEVNENYNTFGLTDPTGLLVRYAASAPADFDVFAGQLRMLDSSGNNYHANLFGQGTTPVLGSMYA